MAVVVHTNRKRRIFTAGAEFVMPVMSYFCKICKEHFVDEYKAEDHCRDAAHNLKYEVNFEIVYFIRVLHFGTPYKLLISLCSVRNFVGITQSTRKC